MDKHFKFKLGADVTIAGGTECGKVIGRAEHLNSEIVRAEHLNSEIVRAEHLNSEIVRYIAGDGRAVEAWWHEDALA